jgi:hypothetical protein
MSLPKVVFKYSRVYDQKWKERINLHPKKNTAYPSEKRIQNYILRIEKLWRGKERKILTEMTRVTGLKWKSKTILCYVVGRCTPFSEPLTMPVYENRNYFIDVLTHELIHQLFTQPGNLRRAKKSWSYIDKKYRNQSRKTRIHILLHAIHSHIYFRIFNEKRLERDIELISHLPDYRKSWQIVQKEGYKNIIREFKRRVE